MSGFIEWDSRKKKRKLLHGEKVEVRTLDAGFEGSWHSGVVIACKNHIRDVQYDHMLVDDESGKLIESITVPSTIEGKIPTRETSLMYRGRIRPLPPPLVVEDWKLYYGLCVDALYNDAWWEGVIFDHEDGSRKRLIFFPDLGDAMTFKTRELRITQDWDEVLEVWKPRGHWLFLELIEQYEQELPSLVSVRQIWYDVREKEDFGKISEWTVRVESLWGKLVYEVINDYLNPIVNKIVSSINLEDGVNLAEVQSKRRKTCGFEDLMESQSKRRKTSATGYVSDIPFDLGSCALVPENGYLVSNDPICDDEPIGNPAYSAPNPVDFFSFSANEKGVTTNTNTSNRESEAQVVVRGAMNDCGSRNDPVCGELNSKKPLKSRRKDSWLPAVPMILPGAEYHPDAIEEYIHNPCRDVVLRMRKHLLHLLWRVEFRRGKFRYVSPEGKHYYSLREVCMDLLKISPKNQLSLVDVHSELLVSSSPRNSLPCKSFHSRPCGETLMLDLPKRGVVPMNPCSNAVDIEPEYCLQAIIDWYWLGSREKKERFIQSGDKKSSDLISKAKKHLSAVGWKFRYIEKKEKNEKVKRELRYISPRGRCYCSLRTACRGYMDEEGFSESITTAEMLTESVIENRNPKDPLTAENFLSAPIYTKFEQSVLPPDGQLEKGSTESSGSSQSHDFVEFEKAETQGIRKQRKRRNSYSFHLASRLLQSQTNADLQTRQDGLAIAVLGNRKPRHPSDHIVCYQKLRKGKASEALINQGDNLDCRYPNRVLRSSKRARSVQVPSPAHHTPRTILSWLIDNDVVLPRAKVHYICRKDRPPMAEGRITRDGIRCSCCQKVFTLSKFEAHSGRTNRCPDASIFLEDGRSLLDCQRKMVRENKMWSFAPEPHQRIKSNQCHYNSDYICSVCHYGGTLILCDQCPSSFHLSCLGLEDLPEGKWFCPSCRCGICGQSEFNENNEQFTEKTVLYCDQCEREYHVGCLRRRGQVKLKSSPKGNWFCSKKCKEIFVGLHKLLGKSVPVGADDLSLTILKFIKDDSHNEAMIECHSKLNVALGVMHECFEPIKEPRTKRDLVEDVIFSKGSELKRLNFRGFYTVLLEREDELISVATFRVYGEKVAEVPLVGTCVQYRRLGMCRLLMNELEKKLMELGVERLLLPAVPQVLHTWTTSFGFSKTTDSERLKFLEYTFLDFQDTTMCQKLLLKMSAVKSTAPRGSIEVMREDVDFDRCIIASEVIQAEQVEKSEIVDQNPVDVPAGSGSKGCVLIKTALPIIMVTQAIDPEINQHHSEISVECLVKNFNERMEDGFLKNGYFKYYTRRNLASGN